MSTPGAAMTATVAATPVGRRSRCLLVLVALALLCLVWPLSPSIGLLAGLGYALLCGNPAPARTSVWSRWLLQASVVGLGCGMNLGAVWRVASHTVGYTMAGIGATLALGLALGRWAGLRRDLALLVATGTAICGGSAIAAVACVIKPKAHEITLALTAVFLLNAVALFVFPPLGHALGFSPHQFGLWAALAIHDTSSVVGAALRYAADAVDVATTVKLTRALWIVPIAIALGRWWPREAPARGSWRRLPLPGFIVGFLVAAALFSYVPALADWKAPLAGGAQRLFAVTLFLIGSGLSREALREVGVRPLLVALALWVVVAGATAAGIHAGWIA